MTPRPVLGQSDHDGPIPDRTGSTPRIIITDGSGDRYEVLDYATTFYVRALDRPYAQPVAVSYATLRELGVEWDGVTLKKVGGR